MWFGDCMVHAVEIEQIQHRITKAANKSNYQAEVRRVKEAVANAESSKESEDATRAVARLHGGKAQHASRWKIVVPTEEEYRLSDEFYRYAVRRDLASRLCCITSSGTASD